jgi:hypothetical protein
LSISYHVEIFLALKQIEVSCPCIAAWDKNIPTPNQAWIFLTPKQIEVPCPCIATWDKNIPTPNQAWQSYTDQKINKDLSICKQAIIKLSLLCLSDLNTCSRN